MRLDNHELVLVVAIFQNLNYKKESSGESSDDYYQS